MSATGGRLLFDLPLPAHVHLFKHTISELRANDHDVCVTAGPSQLAGQLLEAAGIEYQPLTTPWHARLVGFPDWAVREYKLLGLAKRYDPDIVVSHMNPAATHAACVSGAESIVFNDSERLVDALGTLTHPFATLVCTPGEVETTLGPRQRRHGSYHQLAYLHPDRFEPDTEPLHSAGVDPQEPYFVLRFGAETDDETRAQFTEMGKTELVESLARRGSVFVYTAGEIPAHWPAEAPPVAPEHAHDLLAHANLFVGDRRTMALEAAVLGTPTVAYIDEQADGPVETLDSTYSLLYAFREESEAVVHSKSLARDPIARERWETRRQQLLDDSPDLTSYMVELLRRRLDSGQVPDSEPALAHTHDLA